MRLSAPNQLCSWVLLCVAVAMLQTKATAATIVLPDPLLMTVWSRMLLTLLVLPAAYAIWRRWQFDRRPVGVAARV